MFALIFAVLLQAPDDLAGFVASLEKERAAGATNEAILKKIDEWSAGKLPETVVRIGWNRALYAASDRLDALFLEGLKKRIGKDVKLGSAAGTLREIKPDRIILGVAGGTIDVMLSSIPPDVRLADIKKMGLLPARSLEESIFLFAVDGKSFAGLVQARSIADPKAKETAFAAFVGKVLQDLDRALAKGPLLKVAEDFAASWAKEAELLAAADGALRKHIDLLLAPKLLEEAETLLATDRAAARKHLDLATALSRDPELLKTARGKLWSYLAPGEWFPIALDALALDDAKLEGGKIVLEKTEKGSWSYYSIRELPVAWEEVSGVRMKIRPGTVSNMNFRVSPESEDFECGVALQVKDGWMWYQKRKENKIDASNATELTKKAEYQLRVEASGKSWKLYVDYNTMGEFSLDGGPRSIKVMTDVGKAEITGLEVRKK